MTTTIAPARLVRAYRPGFLLGSLGWLNEQLPINLVREPEFLALLFRTRAFRHASARHRDGPRL